MRNSASVWRGWVTPSVKNREWGSKVKNWTIWTTTRGECRSGVVQGFLEDCEHCNGNSQQCDGTDTAEKQMPTSVLAWAAVPRCGLTQRLVDVWCQSRRGYQPNPLATCQFLQIVILWWRGLLPKPRPALPKTIARTKAWVAMDWGDSHKLHKWVLVIEYFKIERSPTTR